MAKRDKMSKSLVCYKSDHTEYIRSRTAKKRLANLSFFSSIRSFFIFLSDSPRSLGFLVLGGLTRANLESMLLKKTYEQLDDDDVDVVYLLAWSL